MDEQQSEPIAYLVWAPDRMRPGPIGTAARVMPDLRSATAERDYRSRHRLSGSAGWIVTPLPYVVQTSEGGGTT